MREFQSARIEKVENGYQVQVTSKMINPSKQEIADMSSPDIAMVEGDTVTDYKEYNAVTLDNAIQIIKDQESEDENG